MNWRTLDLNLLVVFDAVAEARSATQAAIQLNMTQPAISHALARLRGALGDELFVRTPDGMSPTPFAERLAGPVRAALQGLGAALDNAAPFDPAQSDRRFTIALDNRAALALAAPVAAAVAAVAPGVVLDLRPSGSMDVVRRMDRSELDLMLGSMAAPGERFSDVRLFNTGYAVLLRRGHPAAAEGLISVADLAAYPHLDLSSGGGEDTGFLDAALAEAGARRHIALRAPLITATHILAQTDMLAVVLGRTADALAEIAPLQAVALPFPSPTLAMAMLWHRRLDDVPAHRWLRSVVLHAVRTNGRGRGDACGCAGGVGGSAQIPQRGTPARGDRQ